MKLWIYFLLSVFFVGMVSAEVFYEADFEDDDGGFTYTNGLSWDLGSNGLNGSSGSLASGVIDSGHAHKFVNLSAVSDIIYFEYYFYFTDLSGAGLFADLGLWDVAFEQPTEALAFLQFISYSNVAELNIGTTWNGVSVLSNIPVTLDAYNRMVFVWDRINETMSGYVYNASGALVGSLVNVDVSGAEYAYIVGRTSLGPGTVYPHYWDNLRIYTVDTVIYQSSSSGSGTRYLVDADGNVVGVIQNGQLFQQPVQDRSPLLALLAPAPDSTGLMNQLSSWFTNIWMKFTGLFGGTE